jgi:23S rRNA (cytidine1920-2'-O)/16S rRNA (cytidine1409-2'-O)-methyltransferase
MKNRVSLQNTKTVIRGVTSISPEKTRLDVLLYRRGMAESREKARALIMAGNVIVNGEVIDKAGTLVSSDADIHLKDRLPFVSRGGHKLEHALKEFGVSVQGITAMDVGASTGGFTDCLLQHGVEKVYAIDVGYGQFDLRLRNNERVTLLEKTNIRYLAKDALPEPVDLAVIDVSFISLLKVIPPVSKFLKQNAKVIALIKPQFEAGREHVSKGGVVRDENVRNRVIDNIKENVAAMGFLVIGVTRSPIKGPKGNVEYLLLAKKEREKDSRQ